MTNEQFVEQIATVLAETENSWEYERTGKPPAYFHKFARAILPIVLAAREEGARAMQEACAKDAAAWFPAGSESRYPASGVVASIRALDPAKIAGGSDA